MGSQIKRMGIKLNIQIETIEVSHEDERRKLTAVFNGDFDAKQVKIIEVKKDSELGNHYHTYRELFYILKGYGIFYLVDIKTGERISVTLLQGNRLIIAPEIAHKVEMKEGTISIEATESPYESAEVNDKEFKVFE